MIATLAGGAAEAAPGTARRQGAWSVAQGSTRPLLMVAFMFSLVIPAFFFIGSMRLTPYRILLLLAFVPLAFQWIMGRYGGVKTPDLFLLAFCAWSALALTVRHGIGEIWEFSGIFVVETFGSYLLARATIRNIEAFALFVKTLLLLSMFLLVLAFLESTTGRTPLNDLVRSFTATFPWANMQPRWGLFRAQTAFEHPILYGVFVSSGFALYLYTFGRGRIGPAGLFGAAVSVGATFFSLSTGAFISIVLQAGLTAWDKVVVLVTRRWRLLLLIVVALYVTIDMLSNRTPFTIFIDYATFNSGSAYNRVLIWNYGTAEVWRNPVFGIGLNDWIRAPWMSTSMDNLWLLQAVRYGIPAFILLTATFYTMMMRAGMRDIADPYIASCRKGLLIALGGVCLSICTVHLWNATWCFLMFMLGAAAFFTDAAETARPGGPSPANFSGARRTSAPAAARSDIAGSAPAVASARRARSEEGEAGPEASPHRRGPVIGALSDRPERGAAKSRKPMR